MVKYIVIEVQKPTKDGNVSILSTTHDSKSVGESKYFDVLHYAAVSPTVIHGAMLMTEFGNVIKSEFYDRTYEEENK